ncbi:hypothetical protein CYMTET_30237 [Cymbomonas tetramitiformis]|uniref:Uncharacterized protein n=1 Tax=Cymbomonas tetramitiformis TaxID=36881 RepID=A0AAE0FJ84_9CHLO|nr:hypothetical protein CYMTET_30237 [Cymbomonas tetramitiformis]
MREFFGVDHRDQVEYEQLNCAECLEDCHAGVNKDDVQRAYYEEMFNRMSRCFGRPLMHFKLPVDISVCYPLDFNML